MAAVLNDRVIAALERAHGATLVFDLAAIEANVRRVAAAARASGIRVLFAAKSFPHAAVRALAAEHLDGFDVASPAELRDVPASAIVSIADPSGAAIAEAGARAGRVIVSCETVEQVRAAPAHAEIAIRISASLANRDPAVGAVLEGSGRRTSRFGLDSRDAIATLRDTATTSDGRIASLRDAACGRRVGLHVHHGPVVATTAERFVATAHAVLAAADFEPAFLDLGGAWHGIADLAAAFAEIRAAVPASIELIAEPGRLFSHGAGFACGRIAAARELADRLLLVTELSRICHLRWSHVDLVAPAPHPGAGRNILVVGPTCFEEDVLGEWTVEPAAVASRVIFRGVTGYALAWNTGFAGVPPADVVVM
jgi:diaminopimelate decarboxylase